MKSSLDGIFKPNSIAVIGSSSKKGTIGHSILYNLIEYNFNGKVFPVNPKAKVIHSIKCYSTIAGGPNDGNSFVTTGDCEASKAVDARFVLKSGGYTEVAVYESGRTKSEVSRRD